MFGVGSVSLALDGFLSMGLEGWLSLKHASCNCSKHPGMLQVNVRTQPIIKAFHGVAAGSYRVHYHRMQDKVLGGLIVQQDT